MARNDGAHSLNPSDRPEYGDPRLDRDLEIRHDEPLRVEYDRPTVEQRVSTKPAKTSAAAAFALVFGLSALLSVLTVILSPLGLVLGLIGIALGVVGMKMAKRPGVTGKGVAIAGLVLSVLAVLLTVAIAIGLTTFVNDDSAVNRLEQQVERLRDQLPTDVNVPQP